MDLKILIQDIIDIALVFTLHETDLSHMFSADKI